MKKSLLSLLSLFVITGTTLCEIRNQFAKLTGTTLRDLSREFQNKKDYLVYPINYILSSLQPQEGNRVRGKVNKIDERTFAKIRHADAIGNKEEAFALKTLALQKALNCYVLMLTALEEKIATADTPSGFPFPHEWYGQEYSLLAIEKKYQGYQKGN